MSNILSIFFVLMVTRGSCWACTRWTLGTIGCCFELAIDTILPAVLGRFSYHLLYSLKSALFLTRACLFEQHALLLMRTDCLHCGLPCFFCFLFTPSLDLAVVGLCLEVFEIHMGTRGPFLSRVLFVAYPVCILLQLVIGALNFSYFSAFV